MTRAKVIQFYVEKEDLSKQIVQLIKCGKGIFMDALAKINLSPMTIGKRQKTERLRLLYELLG